MAGTLAGKEPAFHLSTDIEGAGGKVPVKESEGAGFRGGTVVASVGPNERMNFTRSSVPGCVLR